jgi:pyroglutamyl-peptidase
MPILVTGFTPFGGHKTNSSQAVVAALAAELTFLETAVLRTEYLFAGDEIVRLIREKKPSAIICPGMNERSAQIRLETVARNWDNCPRPDNVGELREGRVIIKDAAESYPSTLPVGRFEALLGQNGIDATLSEDAGNYLCNHVFFRACHENMVGASRVPCGFIHIPPLLEATGSLEAARPLASLVQGIRLCLSELGKG